jgi:uncharacterized membrane protein YeaQ/YmgE (transglycosylase-associated protein family)
MQLVLFLAFGLIVGASARLIVPERDLGGWMMSMVFAVAGSLLGGFLARALQLHRLSEILGFLMSILGGVALVYAYHTVVRRNALA